MVSVCPVWSTAQLPACAGDQSQKTQEQGKVMDDGIFDPPKKKSTPGDSSRDLFWDGDSK